MAQPIPLDPSRHAKLRVRKGPDFSLTEGQQVLPVVVHEFAPAGNDAPVVFIKNAETGQFQAVMLLGLAQGENLLYRNGNWQGIYIPGVLRQAPFRLLKATAESDTVSVGIDPESALVSDSDGELLFGEDGKPSDYMARRRDEMQAYFQQGQVTRAFVALLAEKELLVSQTLTMDLGGDKIRVEGIYLVDEAKLQALPDDEVLDLHKRGFLQAIYAHLMSLRQASRLAKMKVTGAGNGTRILGT